MNCNNISTKSRLFYYVTVLSKYTLTLYLSFFLIDRSYYILLKHALLSNKRLAARLLLQRKLRLITILQSQQHLPSLPIDIRNGIRGTTGR
jgi:hypothetical protein